MATQAAPPGGPRRNPPRLNIINPSISFTPQQAQALFSPAIQTAIHTGVNSGFPLHTPMQPFFNGPGQPPNAPPRRGHGHQGRASISHFPGAQPIATPIGGHFPRQSMALPNGMPSPLIAQGPPVPGQPGGPIIVNNGPPTAGLRPHRRQMSIGGPPKAVLGGPQRKVSPSPAAAAVAAVGAATLKKKINVNIPKETELVEDDQATTDNAGEGAETGEGEEKPQKRIPKDWARVPLSVAEGEAIMASHLPIPAEELVSREPFLPDEQRLALPGAIEVFLPSKSTWDTLKQQVIEAKLEKLGVERGSGSNVPHIFAPHARAASISSPADPALLLFKLNKLQQTQTAQALSPSIATSTSVAPSPGLPMGATPPNVDAFQSRHGHTMSLAQPPSYMANGGLNPNFRFGPVSPGDLERPLSAVSDGGATSSLTVLPNTTSRPASRPDFVRGFGLDVPEEAEEEAELDAQEREHEMRRRQSEAVSDEDDAGDDAGNNGDTEEDVGSEGEDMELDDDGTAPHTTVHSRHVSRISAALSLRSIGGNQHAEDGAGVDEDGGFIGRESSPPPHPNRRQPGLPSIFGHAIRHSISANREDFEDAVAVQEWTGSEEETEDLSDFDDEESLGEFSNPSDEERARHERVERRMEKRAEKEEAKRRRRLMRQRGSLGNADGKENAIVSGDEANQDAVIDQPRRIPNFPRPPENNDLVFVPTQREHYHHPPSYPSAYQDRDEIISNPSEENLPLAAHAYRYPQAAAASMPYPSHGPLQTYQQPQFLGITPTGSEVDFFNGAPRSPGGTRLTHPLPPVGPHSRGPSDPAFGQPSLPAYNHQHQGSFGQQSSTSFGQSSAFGLVSPTLPSQNTQSSVTAGRRESLNPFAKPFVFGQPLSAQAEPWVPGAPLGASTSASSVPSAGDKSEHARLSSLAKTLNVAAPEFKPRAAALPTSAEFTFSMPNPTPGFPVVEPSVPLSALAASSLERSAQVDESSPIRKQGREKRPRLGSSHADQDGVAEFVEKEIEAEAEVVNDPEEISPLEVKEGDSMTSFRFPPGPSPKIMRKSHSHQPQQRASGLSADIPVSTSVSLDGRGEGADAGSEVGSDMYEVDSEEEDKENRREDTPDPAPSSRLRLKAVFGDSSAAADVESVGNDTQDTAKSPVKATPPVDGDDEEYVQELIIPPTLPITNLSATFPTSATMSSTPIPVSFSPISGSANKNRRAPIPLDFKHPTGNTVPAGLFKAVVQNVIQKNRSEASNSSLTVGSAGARRNRLGSREIYETHMGRPSLDDLNITKISGTGIASNKAKAQENPKSIHLPNFTGTVANRSRNATDPIRTLQLADDDDDVFGSRQANTSGMQGAGVHRRRRSSLPDALRDPTSESEVEDDDEDDHDSDAENRYGNSSVSANPSHTVHLSQSGRRVLQALSISRSQSPLEVSARMERMRRSETPGVSPSMRPAGLGSQLELHALEDVLARVLDERLHDLRRELSSESTAVSSSGISSKTEAMLSEVISLFRAQLSDSAAKSLEDTTMEARGDMDMFMIKEMLEDSQKEVVELVRKVVEENLNQALAVAREASGQGANSDAIVQELRGVVESAASRTVGAVVETISDLRARQEAASAANSSARAQDRLLDELVSTLTPMLQALRPDAIDYDFLTSQLAQAVKPHISQLIDLASDKRETAGLIIDALLPGLVNALVPTLVPTLTPNLVSSLTPTLVDALSEALRVESQDSRVTVVKEVKKAVEGIDPIEIREQVADLVVERLDARLTVRDKSFLGAVNASVSEVVGGLSERLGDTAGDNKRATAGISEESLKNLEQNVVQGVREATANLGGISQEVEEVFRRVDQQQQRVAQSIKEIADSTRKSTLELETTISGALSEVASKRDLEILDERILAATSANGSDASKASSEIKSILEALLAENKALAARNAELVASQQSMTAKLDSLPASLNSAIVNLQNGVSELIVSRDAPKKDLEDLKKLNSEYQVQLTKARAAHGQVRVEKDMMGERLAGLESERDKLRAKVAELESSKKEDLAAVEARKSEFEEALANALGRLQASDVASQMHQQRISELEKAVKEAGAEKTALKAKLDDLEIRATVAEKELANAAANLDKLQREQEHWEDLKQASEKIDMLTKLIGEVESDEIKELRRYHDRTKTIEADYTALQKRVKDLEIKVATSEKVATTTKASLAQAQQRSAEWERRANEYEGELELVKTKLDHAEQTHSQLEADHSLLKIQFEEKEADDRLNKDVENKQREKIAALESKVVRLQDELLKARTGARPAYRNVTNGSATHPPPRPDSRSSVNTVNGNGDRHISSFSPGSVAGTPPTASVWDSIHAPSNDSPVPSRYPSAGVSGSIHAPKSRYPNLTPSSNPRYPSARRPAYPSYTRANAPSPAPSNISAAPTQRDDGWWE